MGVQLYAMTCGWLTVPLAGFLEGEEGRLAVPVPSYLIVHPRGRVLFDAGLHLDTQHDAAGYLGRAAKIFEIAFEPGEEVSARLAAVDIGVGEIDYVIASHLHFDHVGGLAQIPDARLVIQSAEWAAGREPDLIASNGYRPTDYDLGHDVLEVSGEHDLFGDASVVTVPTHGHTPGHQSLKVRLGSREVILAGDACYLRRSIEDMHLPRTLHDREATIESLRLLKRLERQGAQIFYGHDPDFWETVPQAPLAVV